MPQSGICIWLVPLCILRKIRKVIGMNTGRQSYFVGFVFNMVLMSKRDIK